MGKYPFAALVGELFLLHVPPAFAEDLPGGEHDLVQVQWQALKAVAHTSEVTPSERAQVWPRLSG